jgi:hypothetical protein
VQREVACILKNRACVFEGEVYFDFNFVRADDAAKIVDINIWTFIVGYLDIISANGLNKAGAVTAITACCDPCASGTGYYEECRIMRA